MSIGETAKRSGLSNKMIRDYEKIGLIRPARHSESGYHCYTERDLESLSFIRHTRDVDFSLAQIKTLLRLRSNPQHTSAEVRRLTTKHIATLQAKIDHLRNMVNTLENQHGYRCGNNRPDCPIIEQLSDTESCRTNTEAV